MKPSRFVVVVVVWTICVTLVNSCASDPQSSRAEAKKLDHICGRLPGSTLGDTTWQELDPYIVKPDALRHLEVTCSDVCKGSLALRGGYFIDYWYMSPKEVYVTTRGERIRQRRADWNRVYAVVLRRGDKTIQSYSTKWEAQSH